MVRPEDVQGGKKLHEQIDEAIRLYDKLLLVLSEGKHGKRVGPRPRSGGPAGGGTRETTQAIPDSTRRL